MSARRKVAIVGAGMVGVSTAIRLQRSGHEVVLIDRLGVGEGASFGNGGVLASSSVLPVTMPGLLMKTPKMLFSPRQPLFLKWGYLPKLAPWLLRYLSHANSRDVRARAEALLPIIGNSLDDHRQLAAGTGAERWIMPSDYLFIYNDRAHFEGDRFGWDIRRDLGFEWEVLEGRAFKDADPAFGPALKCAVRLQNHGVIRDPGRYVKDLWAHAETSGGHFIQADVTDFTRENGVVTGVRAGGETLFADEVVLATGAWSRTLAAGLGLNVPIETERGYHLELWEPSITPRAPVMIASGKFVATPMEGRLRLAGMVEFAGLDAPPSEAPFRLLERNIREAMPGLTWKESKRWMGHRPSMADSTPVIGPVPGLQGAWVGFGHDHIGLTGGPKTGQILSQLISAQRPNIDISAYSPERFL